MLQGGVHLTIRGQYSVPGGERGCSNGCKGIENLIMYAQRSHASAAGQHYAPPQERTKISTSYSCSILVAAAHQCICVNTPMHSWLLLHTIAFAYTLPCTCTHGHAGLSLPCKGRCVTCEVQTYRFNKRTDFRKGECVTCET